jgi:hypothetical protein
VKLLLQQNDFLRSILSQAVSSQSSWEDDDHEEEDQFIHKDPLNLFGSSKETATPNPKKKTNRDSMDKIFEMGRSRFLASFRSSLIFIR